MTECFQVPTTNWTICGFCMEKVYIEKDHIKDHGCEIIKSLKKSFDNALNAIQIKFMGEITRLENNTNYCHTDIESTEYKNHQLLLENIDLLKKEIMDLRSAYLEDHARQIDENRKVSRRVDEIEEWINKEYIEIKANEFKKDMDNGNRFMECIAGCHIKISELEERQKFLNTNWEKIHRLEKEIDKLIEFRNATYDQTARFNDGINELRDCNERQNDRNIRNNERIKELEKLTKNLQKMHDEILNVMEDKKPFKCPICNGSGRHYFDPCKPLSGIEAFGSAKDEKGMSYEKCRTCRETGIVWG